MKKIFLKVLILCVALCSALTFFVACNCGGNDDRGNNPPPHLHTYDRQVVSDDYKKSDATCESKAVYYYSCECGEKGTATFETGNLENHNYIDGKCKWCEKDESVIPQPPAHTHDYTKQVIHDDYEKSGATCESPAIYYYSCECGEKGTGTFEYGSELGHAYGDWVSNGDGTHSQICANDNKHKKTENCSGGEATEQNRAVCDVCKSEYGATLNHTHSYIQQKTTDKFVFKKATCESVAVYYYSCECGERGTETFEFGTELGHDYDEWTSNGDGTHSQICKNDDTHVVTEGCSGGTATCTQQAKCLECNGGYGELEDHIYDEIESNDTQHWNECDCGAKDEIAGHTGGEATCEKKAVCSVCSQPYGTVVACVFVNGVCKWCNDSLPAFTRDGETIYFGSYPQTKVTDEGTQTALLNIAGNPINNTAGWTSYNYYVDGVVADCMYYKDVTLDNQKYRGVYIKDFRPHTIPYGSDINVQEKNGYANASVYWFKYEPINWEVVEEVGLNVKLVSRMIIDSREFDYKNGSYSNNYAESTIRAWLNDEFYNMAFNDLEKALIQNTLVDNRPYTTRDYKNPNTCENTNDNVWLISCEEVWDYFSIWDDSRSKVTTDYARAQGAYTYPSSGDLFGKGNFWYRSPHDTTGYAWCGVFGGPTQECDVRETKTGVAPVLIIRAGDESIEHKHNTLTHNSYKHWYECECGNKSEIELHKGGTATCQEAARCEICEVYYGGVLDHDYSEVKYDELEHWNECSCGEKQEVESHKGGEATCESRAVCSVCGQPYGAFVSCVYVNGNCKWCNEKEPPAYVREGNYIYFGEYPQTIKKDSVTITEIQDSRGYYLGSDNEFYAKVECYPYYQGFQLSDGTALQYDLVLYFKVEPVKWRILNEENGTALILCESVIDSRNYDTHVSNYNFNYANSAIRKWLNDEFYNNIFSDLQKQLILTTNVDNSVSSTAGSNYYSCVNTKDKVFLLSYKDLITGPYGFNASYEENSYRQKTASDYALANGARVNNYEDDVNYGNVYWLTRSPYGSLSSKYDSVLCVTYAGKLDDYCNTYSKGGIVPALVITINDETEEHEYNSLNYNETQHWHECDCGCGGKENLENHKGGEATCEDKAVCSVCGQSYGTTVSCVFVSGYCKWCNEKEEPLYTRNGDYIYFGRYPQTIKADNVTVSATANANGYYLGSDGEEYAKVVGNPHTDNYTFSNDEIIIGGTVYYFKVEPIRWIILSEGTDNATLLCDSIIENRRYDDTSVNYKDSEIRAWLNNEFYNKAFSKLERELILTTTVDNSALSTGYTSNSYACENTEDKIYLLSFAEAKAIDGTIEESVNRQMITSDYTRANGVAGVPTSSELYGLNFWLLRSPLNKTMNNFCLVRYVTFYGALEDDRATNVTTSNGGIVPALKIKL